MANLYSMLTQVCKDSEEALRPHVPLPFGHNGNMLIFQAEFLQR